MSSKNRNGCTLSTRSGAMPCCSASSCTRRCRLSRHHPEIWIIQDSQPSITLGVLFFSIHVFRMTTFFLIAGFFAHLSFHRRGAWGFIKDRLQRIALPLVGRLADPVYRNGHGRDLGRQLSQWRAPTRPAKVAAGAATIPADATSGFSMSCWNSTSPCWCCASAWSGSTQTAASARVSIVLIGLVMQSRLAPAILAVPIGIALASIRHGSAGSACERLTHPSSPTFKP